MAYLHGEDAYKKDCLFSQEEFAALTPNDIKRWMCCKQAYGTCLNQAPMTIQLCAESTSIDFWKKAKSSIMLNGLMSWNVCNNLGNPIQSI
jgi:hypothetical protein